MRKRSYSSIKGRGDYQVNQIIKGGSKRPLTFASAKNLSGDVYITHREFVQNVTVQPPVGGTGGSTPFTISTVQLNPGLVASFPFLSQIAQAFTLYEFLGLVFEYKPTSGEYGSSSSNQLGKVIMATNYDPDAPAFTNSVSMENYDYANSSKPSVGLLHGVESKHSTRATNVLYTRSGTSAKDKIFTDVGTFYIATEGIQFANSQNATAAIVGELWVSYKVKFSRANVGTAISGTNILWDQFCTTCSAGPVPASGTATWCNGSNSALAGGQATDGNPNRYNFIGLGANWAPPMALSNLGGVFRSNLTQTEINLITNPLSLAAANVPVATYLPNALTVAGNGNQATVGVNLQGLCQYKFPPNLGAGTYMITISSNGGNNGNVMCPNFVTGNNPGWRANGNGGMICTNCTPYIANQNTVFDGQFAFFKAAVFNAGQLVNNSVLLDLSAFSPTGAANSAYSFTFGVTILSQNAMVTWNMNAATPTADITAANSIVYSTGGYVTCSVWQVNPNLFV